MKKNTKIKLAGILLGAALSSTGAYAGDSSCGANGKMEKDGMKHEKAAIANCGAKAKKGSSEMMDKKDMKASKKVNGSCGAGKCSS
jgi:hypothetical protein